MYYLILYWIISYCIVLYSLSYTTVFWIVSIPAVIRCDMEDIPSADWHVRKERGETRDPRRPVQLGDWKRALLRNKGQASWTCSCQDLMATMTRSWPRRSFPSSAWHCGCPWIRNQLIPEQIRARWLIQSIFRYVSHAVALSIALWLLECICLYRWWLTTTCLRCIVLSLFTCTLVACRQFFLSLFRLKSQINYKCLLAIKQEFGYHNSNYWIEGGSWRSYTPDYVADFCVIGLQTTGRAYMCR